MSALRSSPSRDDIALGRRAARAIVAGTVLTSLVMLGLRIRGYGTGLLSVELFRFTIAVAMIVLVYRGVNWARLLCGVIFGFGGTLGIFVAIGQRNDPLLFSVTLAFALFYAVSGYLLLRSPALRAFFVYQQDPEMH